MKKSRNVFLILIFILLLIGIIGGIVYSFKNRRTYLLQLPQFETLESISLTQEGKETAIVKDIEDMQKIIDILTGTKRITKNASVQDLPVNVLNEIKVDFNSLENEDVTLFLYSKKGKYFIEQPYNGIYKVSNDLYNAILKYVRYRNND